MKRTIRKNRKVALYDSIWIEGEYGSPFQRKFAIDSLIAFLSAWQNQLRLSHKSNKIKIMVGDKTLVELLGENQ